MLGKCKELFLDWTAAEINKPENDSKDTCVVFCNV